MRESGLVRQAFDFQHIDWPLRNLPECGKDVAILQTRVTPIFQRGLHLLSLCREALQLLRILVRQGRLL